MIYPTSNLRNQRDSVLIHRALKKQEDAALTSKKPKPREFSGIYYIIISADTATWQIHSSCSMKSVSTAATSLITHTHFQHMFLNTPLHTILFLSVPAKHWFINQHRELINKALLQSKLISLQTCTLTPRLCIFPL